MASGSSQRWRRQLFGGGSRGSIFALGAANEIAMPSRRLVRALKRAGVTEPWLGVRGDLFSEPVLLVDSARSGIRRDRRSREVAAVYDRAGNLRASVRRANSVDRTALSSADLSQVVVDVRDEILMALKIDMPWFAQPTITAIAADGTEVATVTSSPRRHGLSQLRRKPDYPIQSAGKTIGCVRWAAWSAWTVRDADDTELTRVTNVSPRFGWLRDGKGCNVIQIDERMPRALRPVVLAVSAWLFERKSSVA